MAAAPASNQQSLASYLPFTHVVRWFWIAAKEAFLYHFRDTSKEIKGIESSPYCRHVQVATRLAREAGANIRAHVEKVGTDRPSDLQVTVKTTAADLVTDIDVKNEQLVTAGLRSVFPKDVIIGEESVEGDHIPALDDEPTWIIDPIDGTTNFAHGLPETCVSIGYCQHGKPVVGVVYAPLTDELYVGIDGLGAFRNGQRISCQDNQNTTLAEALVCFEWGYPRSPEAVRTMLGVTERLVPKCKATRQLGSGVLDLCHVASGRLHAVYAGVAGEGWKPWDYCAGWVIATQAGAVMETIQAPLVVDGDQKEKSPTFDIYAGNHICAVNQKLLGELRSVILDKAPKKSSKWSWSTQK